MHFATRTHPPRLAPNTSRIGRYLAIFIIALLLCHSPAAAGDAGLTAEERQWLAAHPVLRIGIRETPPLIVPGDKGGGYKGLSIDYIKMMEKRLGVPFTLVNYPTWQKLIDAAKQRQVDILVTGTVTLERSAFLDFTPPYIQLHNKIFLRKELENREVTLDDMAGKSVAVVDGTAIQSYIRGKYPEIRLVPMRDELAVLEAVSFGEAHAAVMEVARATYYIDQEKLTNLFIAGDAGYPYNFCFSSRNDWPELNGILVKGLAAITDTERREITSRWIFEPQQNLFKSPAFWGYLGGGIALLLVVHTAIWNVLLRRKVARSTVELQREIRELERAEDELRRLNRTLMVLGKSHEILMQFTEEKSLLQAICRHLVEVGGYRSAWVGLNSPDRVGKLTSVAHYGLAEDAPAGSSASTKGAGHAKEAVSSETAVICRASCQGEGEARAGAGGARSSGASVAIPLWGEGKVIGALEIQGEADSFDREEVNLLTELAENLAYAMVSIRMREEHREAEELVRKLSLAIEQCPVTIVITDREGTIEYVNPYFSKVTGYDHDEVVGQNPRVLKSGVQSAEFYTTLWDIVKGGFEWHGEFCNRKKNGELYWESASISPVRNSEGEITNFIAVKEDITERKQAYAELQEAKAAAEAATNAKSAFLANMSHEIRTPMNAVIGMLYLLQQTDLGEKQQSYLAKAEGAARSLLHVINDILDFSKIEAGRLQMESIPFQLNEVLDRVVDIIPVTIGVKPIEFTMTLSADVPDCLVGDPLRLGQVLLNLASNAVKFTHQGEVSVSVAVETMTDEGVQLRFVVADSGIGMTLEQKGKLFDAFSQADSSTTRRFGGTGLGLAISKQLVGLMGGDIRVESESGRGSRFIFTARFALEPGHHGALAETYAGLAGLQLLHLGGAPGNRLLLDRMLASFGMVVTSIGAGDVPGHGRATIPRFDLLLLDVAVGDPIDRENLLRITDEWHLGGVPAVLFAADGQLNRVEPVGELRKTVVKPVSPATLLHALAEAAGIVDGSVSPPESTIEVEQYFRGRRILLAEDNLINQEVARGILEQWGVEVAIAPNGAIAVEMLRSAGTPYDAVLMDLQMPVMDGLEATRSIRRHDWGREIPIVAMTASAMSEDRQRCEAAGMDDHVAKPVDVANLFAVLHRWLSPGEDARAREPARTPSAPDPALAAVARRMPAIDLEKAVRRLGSRDLLMTVLKEFRRLHGEDDRFIAASLAAGAQEEARRAAHTLKGLARTMAAETLAESARKLESAIAEGRTDEFAPRLAELTGQLGELKESLAVLDGSVGGAAVPVTVPEECLAEEVTPLLRDLAGQLANNNLGACSLVKKLKAHAMAAPLRREFDQLEAAVEKLDFHDAAGCLVNLAGKMKVTL